MSPGTNEWYIEGIKSRSDVVALQIHKDCFPMVQRFIVNNNGTQQDAQDIFMDGMLALYRMTKEKELKLTCKFSTFLFEICKRMWWKKLRRKKFDAEVTPDDEKVLTHIIEAKDTLEESERFKLVRDQFKRLPESCQSILDLSWHTDYSVEQIAELLGFSYAYVCKRKHVCKEKLIEFIKEDQRYVELMN